MLHRQLGRRHARRARRMGTRRKHPDAHAALMELLDSTRDAARGDRSLPRGGREPPLLVPINLGLASSEKLKSIAPQLDMIHVSTSSFRGPHMLNRLAIATLLWVSPLANADERAETPPVAQLSAASTSLESGSAVSLNGEFAFLGAPSAFRDGVVSGAVDVFRRDRGGWTLWQTLWPEATISGSRFGESLASDGDRLLVGAPEESRTGVVYFYRLVDGFWRAEQRFPPPNPELWQFFGSAVSIDRETALVGAPSTTHAGEGHAGLVYVLEHHEGQWRVVHRLFPQPASSGLFGFAVAIRRDRCLVGEPHATAPDAIGGLGIPGGGAVHAFTRQGTRWTRQQRLTLSAPEYGAYFGWALAIDDSGRFAAVGAPGDSSRGVQGSTHILEWIGRWKETKALALEEPAGFGRSVDMSGELLVVGAPFDHSPQLLSGSSYTYRLNGTHWAEERRLATPSADTQEYFGAAVATDGSLVLVGAPEGNGRAPDTGTAFVFSSERCVGGSVAAGAGRISRTLLLNGSTGDGYSTVSLSTSDPIELTMLASPSGPAPGGFVLYASLGGIDPSAASPQPRSIGTMCFRTPLVGGGGLKAIWNNIGRKNRLGTPTRDSHPAPSIIEYIPGGAGRPYVATLQGLIMDNAAVSDLGASVTNAIVLKVE